MKKNQYEKEQPRRRFNKAKYAETIKKLYHLMPTAELARMLGLEPRKVSDYA